MRFTTSLRPVISMLFIVASLLLVTQIGNAASWDRDLETVSLRNSNFELDAARTRSVTLDTWRYVQKVVVKAEARSSRSSFSVWANGEERLVIEPGMNGESTIELRESISMLEFRNLTGGSQILDVSVVQAKDAVSNPPGDDLPGSISNEEALQICRDALRLSDQLRAYSSFSDYGSFLLPIRKSAARAYAQASVRPSLRQLAAALGQLQAQIAASDVYLNEAFEMDAAFNLAIELLTLRYHLEDILR